MNEIAAIVLAAGESVRMGYPKALLPFRAGTFLSEILDALAAVPLEAPRVVVGGHAAAIESAFAERTVRWLFNAEFPLGQLSSIQCALRDLGPEVTAALLWPVDQPAVSAPLVRELVLRQRETGAPLVLPVCGGRRGHPAVVDRSLFEELLGVPPERGAKEVILLHESRIAVVPTGEPGTVDDVDTPEDYLHLTGESVDAALRRTGAR